MAVLDSCCKRDTDDPSLHRMYYVRSPWPGSECVIRGFRCHRLHASICRDLVLFSLNGFDDPVSLLIK